MDSLYWNKLIPDIQVLPTTQLFFKQYVYRLELLAYAGKCINNSVAIEESLAYRKMNHRQINYGGSWVAKSKENVKNSDVEWLKYLQKFKQTLDSNFKIRVEEPKLQIYSESEEDLYEFVRALPAEYRKYVVSVSKPESSAAENLILSGKKIQRKTPTYRFKLLFRDGSYDMDVRRSVLQYLESIDTLVRIPVHFKEAFTRPYNAIWDCYLYSNDVKIATFIQLINPNLIRSIIEMATVDEINTNIIQGAKHGQST